MALLSSIRGAARLLGRPTATCDAASPPIWPGKGQVRVVRCSLPAHHPPAPGWAEPLHVAADGTRFRLTRRPTRTPA